MFHDSQSNAASSLARLYRISDVLAFSGLSRATLWRSIRAGLFPKPMRIGLRSVAWREEDLMKWRASLKENTDLVEAAA